MDKPKKYSKLAKTFCTAIECPAAKAYCRGEQPTLAIKKSDALRDTSGHYWCTACSKSYDLMNWGKLHEWPEVHSSRYAIGPGEDLWYLAISYGSVAMVEEIHAAIYVAESEEAS